MRARRNDCGSGTIDYLALGALAAVILVGLVVADIPGAVGRGAGSVICRIVGGDSCGVSAVRGGRAAGVDGSRSLERRVVPPNGKNGKGGKGGKGGKDCDGPYGYTDPCLKPVHWATHVSDGDVKNKDILDSKLLADCLAKGKKNKKEKKAAEDRGTGKLKHLDSCTFEPSKNLEKFWKWEDIGPTVTNCSHGDYQPSSAIEQQITGSTTHGTTLSKSSSTNVGFSLSGSADTKGVQLDASAGADFGSTTEHGWSDEVTVGSTSTVHVPPNRKVSLTAGTQYQRVAGRIRLNYDTRVNGHYVWYANDIETWVPTGMKQTGQDDKSCDEHLMNGN